ncbi:MAG: type VI secretion system ATPase TssH [Fibrobacteres bacterium]|nr:type VI secretion system ATPase TssH [Fibrobacterota bacterium]
MIATSVRSILEKLNKYTKGLLEGAVGAAVTRSHYEIIASHVLAQALEEGKGDLAYILAYFKVNGALFKNALNQDLKELRMGNTGKPVFSPTFMTLLEAAWAEASLNLGESQIRGAALVLALKRMPSLMSPGLQDQFALISTETLLAKFAEITAQSKETEEAPAGGKNGDGSPAEGSNLARFTTNFTEMARQGKVDPIFGRDNEIRMVVDILSRRRKNNPIMVGEAGVGKTAVIEGLALRIAQGQVPDILKNVEIRGLDMGLMAAGAGVRGEFENRLKGVIKEVKSSTTPIILFIDETHTIIGAGGEAGQNDAANLLKPEMARGELKIMGATTLTEFRKYFEKDPAMARRFQMVKVEEPDPETAAIMLRGLRVNYEKFHGVKITYEGIKAACELSHKYIAGRQLPDKAVDLLDTAAARVKMGLTAKPPVLVNLDQAIENLKIEIATLEKDDASGALPDREVLAKAKSRLENVQGETKEVEDRWKKELEAVKEIIALQDRISAGKAAADAAKPGADGKATGAAPAAAKDAKANAAKAAEPLTPEQEASLREELDAKWKALEAMQGEEPMVHAHVAPEVIAQIIGEWTGIPAGNMLKNEAQALLDLEMTINQRVVGQEMGVAEMASTLRGAKLGLGNPEAPMGVFLVTGPSGVGKTEVARAISDILFGGEKFVVTINMSEYQDSMSVTQLKGASAGYVGYGDGGVLTEGVRRRPYTVVILDEVEKAHKDVLNMFYQVFDKGMLRDGEGRDINFRNTVIIMTSNLGLETITNMHILSQDRSLDEYREAILGELTAHFAPALLGRCKVVPFLPLDAEVLKRIVMLKLMKLGKRLMEKHKLAFAVAPEVVRDIVVLCTTSQSGARNIDTVIDQKLMPLISGYILRHMAEEKTYTHLFLYSDGQGGFACNFSVGDFVLPPELSEEGSGESEGQEGGETQVLAKEAAAE